MTMLILQVIGTESSWEFSWLALLGGLTVYLVLPMLIPAVVGTMCGYRKKGVTRLWGGLVGGGLGVACWVASHTVWYWFAGYFVGCYPCPEWVYNLRDDLQDLALFPIAFMLIAIAGTWGLCWWRNKRKDG